MKVHSYLGCITELSLSATFIIFSSWLVLILGVCCAFVMYDWHFFNWSGAFLAFYGLFLCFFIFWYMKYSKPLTEEQYANSLNSELEEVITLEYVVLADVLVTCLGIVTFAFGDIIGSAFYPFY